MKIVISTLVLFLLGVSFVAKTQAQVDSTTSAIRQKVQAKLDEVIKNPKAYIGTITDITDSTIQITNKSDQIIQVSVANSPTIVKVGTKNQTLKLEDLAIGDFVVAMGYLNSGTVLDASRILVTEELVQTPRKATKGIVAELDSPDVIIETNGETITLKTTRQTDILGLKEEGAADLNFSDVEVADEVIAVGEKVANTISTRRIQIIKTATTTPTSEEE